MSEKEDKAIKAFGCDARQKHRTAGLKLSRGAGSVSSVVLTRGWVTAARAAEAPWRPVPPAH